MNNPDSGFEKSAESASLERRVNRLAQERGDLFDRSSTQFGLSKPEQERLHSIERELDECFTARRTMRAERDARRFNPYARSAGSRRGREVLS